MVQFSIHRPDGAGVERHDSEKLGVYPVIKITAKETDTAIFPDSAEFCRDAAEAFARAAEILEEEK
jgi:hypothetical protein